MALTPQAAPERRRLISEADLATIWVTNPTRRLFGKAGPTKLDVAVYYAAVGDFMLPHLFGRPVSLVRCPTGKPEDCFFQRHRSSACRRAWRASRRRPATRRTATYITVADAKGYLALAQFGVVEFHAWGCLVKRLEQAGPDRARPRSRRGHRLARGGGGGGARAGRTRPARARWLCQDLGRQGGARGGAGDAEAGLEGGARGVGRTGGGDRRDGARDLHHHHGASNRKRRIFIDFHRNARSATAVAPYSLRARNNLPASAPLSWEDLEKIDAPEDLNYSSLPGLVAATGDPWAEIEDFARDLARPVRARA